MDSGEAKFYTLEEAEKKLEVFGFTKYQDRPTDWKIFPEHFKNWSKQPFWHFCNAVYSFRQMGSRLAGSPACFFFQRCLLPCNGGIKVPLSRDLTGSCLQRLKVPLPRDALRFPSSYSLSTFSCFHNTLILMRTQTFGVPAIAGTPKRRRIWKKFPSYWIL